MNVPRTAIGATAALTIALAIGFGLPQPVPAQQRVALAAPTARDGAALRLTLQAGPASFGDAGGKNFNAGANTGARADSAARRSATPATVGGIAQPTPVAFADGGARGVVRAVREATLSSRLAARISNMPLTEGASFKSGDLLVGFDCERQIAEARAAVAAVDVQRKTVDTNEELDKFESIGKNDLSISRSQLDKARAEADALKSQVKDCKLVAPFSGRVIERLAHNHEAVAQSQPLLRVVDTSSLELELIVPSAWLQWLREGAAFKFDIDETGQTVAGSVVRLTPTVDPVSKTIKVIGQFRAGKKANDVLPGMSGTARFAHDQRG